MDAEKKKQERESVLITTNIIIALNAVVPLFFYMILGKLAVRIRVCRESFLTELNRLIFRIFMPFVLFNNLYKLRSVRIGSFQYVCFAIVSLAVLIAVLMAAVPIFEKDDRKKGVIIQAIFRSNCIFYAIPLVQSLFGEEGAALASLVVSVLSPTYNIAAVIVLERYSTKRSSPLRLLLEVLKNPLMMGAIAGALMACLPFSLPDFVLTPISQLSALATPLALFVLGGKFHWEGTGEEWKKIFSVVLIKLIIIPTVLILIMRGLRFSSIELFTMFCMFATPTATTSYAMAENMGGDAPLAGKLVVISTAFSVVTLFLWIFILRTLGFI